MVSRCSREREDCCEYFTILPVSSTCCSTRRLCSVSPEEKSNGFVIGWGN